MKKVLRQPERQKTHKQGELHTSQNAVPIPRRVSDQTDVGRRGLQRGTILPEAMFGLWEKNGRQSQHECW